ncbi:MAG: uridine kinase, partial [Nitratireductor sp.]
MKLSDLTDLILKKADSHDRLIVAVAGPPASGKSTLAEKLCEAVSLKKPSSNPVLVPMDGFHLDNSILDELGLRDTKGAINTFEADGFVRLIKQIHAQEADVKIPEFDRAEDRVIQTGKTVSAKNEIIIVEGNYLFVEEGPWEDLLQFFDVQIFLLPRTKDIEDRLIKRWLDYGFSLEEAKTKA